jgi:hypothetical protein
LVAIPAGHLFRAIEEVTAIGDTGQWIRLRLGAEAAT